MKSQIEGEAQAQQVGSDYKRSEDRDDHRNRSRHEIPPADGRHEARDVYFVKADEEEEYEDADVQEYLYVIRDIDQAGNRSQQHTCCGIGHYGAHAYAAEHAFRQFGNYYKSANK